MVIPSASAIVSRPPLLSTKNCWLIGVTEFTDEIVIGSGGLEFGTIAKFIAPLAYGPLIPGPDKKKPNTSLY